MPGSRDSDSAESAFLVTTAEDFGKAEHRDALILLNEDMLWHVPLEFPRLLITWLTFELKRSEEDNFQIFERSQA